MKRTRFDVISGSAKLEPRSSVAQVLRGAANVTLIEAPAEELRDVDRPEDLAEIEHILRVRG